MTNIIASFYSEEHIYFYKFGTKLLKPPTYISY